MPKVLQLDARLDNGEVLPVSLVVTIRMDGAYAAQAFASANGRVFEVDAHVLDLDVNEDEAEIFENLLYYGFEDAEDFRPAGYESPSEREPDGAPLY